MTSRWDLFRDIITPAVGPLVRMERGGFRVSEEQRQKERDRGNAEKAAAEARIVAVAEGFNAARRVRVQARIDELWGEAAMLCPKHLSKGAESRRGPKCEGCALAGPTVASIRKGRDIIKRLSGGFKLSSDEQWRTLLFEKAPVGMELKPAAGTRTPKLKLPKVDADSIEKLQRKYPQHELLRAKVEWDQADYFVNVALAVPVDENGYAHTTFSMAKSAFGRLASGDDDTEAEKPRPSDAGNQQNIPDEARRIYVPDSEEDLLGQFDWKNIEALVVGHLAGDAELVASILGGGDIHVDNAMLLAEALGIKLAREDADKTPFPYDPKRKSFRQNGKLTHKWNYGLGPKGMERQYGIPAKVCERLQAVYFERRPLLKKWQQDSYEECDGQRHQGRSYLTTAFGRYLWPTMVKGDDGRWHPDREETLASRPQSIVGDMIKKVLPEVEAAIGKVEHGRLITTTHDSVTTNFKTESKERAVGTVRAVMEQKWPQLGWLPGCASLFWCPCDATTGRNWGKFKKDENEEGLR